MEDAQPPKAHREELFDDLERMLREQIAFKPDDLKLRVRLAGLYFERGREAEFLNEAKALRDAMRGNLDSPDWRQIAIIGRRIAPHSPIFDGSSPEADSGKQRRLGEGKREQALFERLTEQYAHLRADPEFLRSVDKELIFSANRPSSLLHAKRYSAHNGGAQILVKREDLMMRGAALITAITGQVMLAKRLGCKTVVTGTVYGQKGIVMASVAARLGLDAVVYMDGEQAHQRSSDVFRMWLTGAQVELTDTRKISGRDIRAAAVRHWCDHPDDSLLVMGLDSGPDPYPQMASDFVSAVGRETALQIRSQFKQQPVLLVARGDQCADAIGFFEPFLEKPKVRLACVSGSNQLVPPAAGSEADPYSINGKSLTAQQKQLADAILDGMEFPAVEREHRALKASGRVEYVEATAPAARRLVKDFSRLEGMIPAIRTAHALAWAAEQARAMDPEQLVVVNVCESVEKDVWDIGRALGMKL